MLNKQCNFYKKAKHGAIKLCAKDLTIGVIPVRRTVVIRGSTRSRTTVTWNVQVNPKAETFFF